jgi:hypothetical protein
MPVSISYFHPLASFPRRATIASQNWVDIFDGLISSDAQHSGDEQS